MERVLKQGNEPAASQRVAQGKFTSKSRESEASKSIDESPLMTAQRKKLQGLFGGAIQRQEGEEEMLQGKFETPQRVEEEEALQGKFATAQLVEEEEPLQGKFEAVQRVEEEAPLQGKFEAASSVQLKEEAAKPNNTGLPDNLKSGIESLSGMSMDNVKVHYNSSQPAQLNALAYAQGTDIHVAPGQEQHLPHEAWHVVQQAQGRVKPTMQMKEGVPVNDDRSLEHEADVMGAKALNSVQAKVAQCARDCTCPACATGSRVPNLSPRADTLGQSSVQLKCLECNKAKGHAPTCSKYKPPKPKEKKEETTEEIYLRLTNHGRKEHGRRTEVPDHVKAKQAERSLREIEERRK